MAKIFNLFVLIAVLSISAYAVLGAPVGGVVDNGAQDRGTESSSGTYKTEGGNVTNVNISGSAITDRWAGFWGSITGSLMLSDSGANVFYEWTVSDVTGAVVYAANSTISNWAGLAAATPGLMPANLKTGALDNFTNTFDSVEAFSSSSIGPIASTPYADTWQDGIQGNLRTYALADGADIVFAAKAQNDVSGFKGAAPTVDYQMLVPGFASGVTYNFYLELP